ncbi:MAG: HAMP domain-containing histidine kinase [Muribaculaceae bacterium]|nr:HAMP domain-containing histidine kinase [Muribaculaceae bacterium]
MKKRIRTLYVTTIIAIFAFLGMQMYWLNERYEFSILEYERQLSEKIEKGVEEYNELRNKAPVKRTNKRLEDSNDTLELPSYNLRQHFGDSIKTSRTTTIYTYRTTVFDILGIKPGTPLTEEMKDKAMQLLLEEKKNPEDSVMYDASGARDENEAWAAAKNVQLEKDCPFSIEGLDSVLKKVGVKAKITLVKEDSMVWKPRIDFDNSRLRPKVVLMIPYSQLEGQVADIECGINPFDILPEMWKTLVVSIFISVLLIICLILQFSTVRKLSRIDKLRNSFITTMIHELKRPISTLKMSVSGLDNERMMEDPATKKEILSETRNALDNLSAYFSKLRDITFNNVEQIPLNIQSVNLHGLFDNVASAIIFPVDKHVEIINRIDCEIDVSADRSHLYNILTNLVENAVKYSGSSVEITAEAVKREGEVEISVSDTGNGISSGDIGHIFQRFYRGKSEASEQPGIGLGLAYVKLLVNAHGGDVTAESREGEGTRFKIILPQ